MVQIKHLYIQYGYAVTLYENNLQDQCNIITPTHLQKSIENGINTFRVIPQNPLIPEQEISFKYENIEKGNPKKGIFLSSHIVTTNRNAQKTWNVASKFLQDLEAENAADQLEKVEDAKVSIIPLSGEFLSFGAKGIDRAKVRLKKRDLAFGLITTLTPLKPSLQIELENYCILPDIPLKQMIEFIALFDKMRRTGLGEKAMTGKTNKEGKPQRPKIFRGNFPHAPKNGAMGAVALLDVIGEYIKEAETSCIAQSVLDSLEGNNLYLIKSGEAIPISFNHYVIEIAKSGNLHSIVDQIYYSHLYKTPKRQYNDPDYERFDFHTARFLQQFNIFILLSILKCWEVPILIMSASLPDTVKEDYNALGYEIKNILEDTSDYERPHFRICDLKDSEGPEGYGGTSPAVSERKVSDYLCQYSRSCANLLPMVSR